MTDKSPLLEGKLYPT